MKVGSAHRAVMLEQAIAALDIKPNGVYVDGTFGRGGHSRAILERLGPQGCLIALDRDPEAVLAGQAIEDERFCVVHARFSELPRVLQEKNIVGVDGVLLDLGVSSPQLDQAQRGFSFKQDGPLDMRMDPTQGMSAQEWLRIASEEQIQKVLKDYGEERAAFQIAKAIVARRGDASSAPIETTGQLAALVAGIVRRRQGGKGGRAAMGKDPATRTFQAIRIFVNQELEELTHVLGLALTALREGGRLAVISFHSLEDRIVKQFLAQQAGKIAFAQTAQLPTRASRSHSTFNASQLSAAHDDDELAPISIELFAKQMASDEEASVNPRARSAVLRSAKKLQVFANSVGSLSASAVGINRP